MYLQKKDKDLFFWPRDKSNSCKNKISSSNCLWDLFQPEPTAYAHPWPIVGVHGLHVLPRLFISVVPLWLFFPPSLVVSQCSIQELCFSHSSCLWSDWLCLCCVQWRVCTLLWRVSSPRSWVAPFQLTQLKGNDYNQLWQHFIHTLLHLFYIKIIPIIPAIIKKQAWKEEKQT